MRTTIINHRSQKPINDFYETPEEATIALLEVLKLREPILDPGAGNGAISNIIKKSYKNVTTLDIDERFSVDKHVDFLKFNERFSSIVMNPPFNLNYEAQWLKHALSLLRKNGLLAALLPLPYLQSKRREQFFMETPPKFCVLV